MFDTQTRVFTVCVAVLLCATLAFSQSNQFYAFSFPFKEKRPEMPDAYATGTLNYVYYYGKDEAKYSRTKLIYDIKLGNDKLTNVYHYENHALYTMCSQCSAAKYKGNPSPWYDDGNFYELETGQPVAGTNNLYWFKRKANVDIDVKKILMTKGNKPGQNGFEVGQVVFEDGRTIFINGAISVENKNKDSDWFTILGDCKTPTCRTYADIIFVMDYSRSVGQGPWKKACQFAYDILHEFSLSTTEVAAAVLQFGGDQASNPSPPTGINNWYPFEQNCKRDIDCPDYCPGRDCPDYCKDYAYENYHHESHYNPSSVPNPKSADYIAPARPSGWGIIPLSTKISDFDGLKDHGGNPDQWTCQGFGLQLAMKIWDDQSQTRNKPGQIPHRIVIVVTDGYDQCPWTTYNAAKDIKEKYGATLIEVGVGDIEKLDCKNKKGEKKDVAFLQSLATSVGGKPYYHYVESYDAIHTLVAELADKVCEDSIPDDSNVGGVCSGCKGMCVCGTCMCPTCDTGNGCKKYECVATTPAKGCQIVPQCDADVHDDKCQAACDENSGTCTKVPNCQKDANHQGECYKMRCGKEHSGDGCYIYYDQTVCNKIAPNNQCVKYECRDPPDPSDPKYADFDPTTGCLKTMDKQRDNQLKIDADGKGNCIESVCNPDLGNVWNRSRCEDRGDALSSQCSDLTCEKIDGVFNCKWTVRNKDTKCATYKCTKTGWQTLSEITQCDAKPCQDVTLDNNYEGCCHYVERECPELCTGNEGTAQDQKCASEAWKKSDNSLRHCWKGVCAVEGSTRTCDFSTQDCYSDKKEAAEHENSLSKKCCNPACTENGCGLVCVDRPAPDNDCEYYVCEAETKDGINVWSWKSYPTQTKIDCVSNECFVAECKPKGGCERTAICTNKTNHCFTYTCENPTSPDGKCVSTSLLKVTECMHEECDANGEKQWVDDAETKCNLTQTFKCLVGKCVYDDSSETSTCSYTDRECVNCDPCNDNTCDNATGLFNNTPKCNDFKFCTEDICTADGRCWYPEISCYDEISMEGYPCFTAKCTEGENTHKCVRKLISGAYIDVCGNCFYENGGSSSSMDLVSCTNAPPKPVLTEGLAAASIALIVLAAILLGAGITISGVFGAKELINRAGGAKNQVAHTNPLFESNETEMTNPTYDGQTM